ncbi:radical SAM family heme chaperone HemW [Hydrogenovibrio halophilus]|uniref:radical SAM family heme chaperone HemW n=1 Tax=Hydrogenovibrio halophilus TaxID=373391 RepID=UPI00036811A9|nr:radical SAM family heme chaperone HemW [Hydrogenovibrio halophilus]
MTFPGKESDPILMNHFTQPIPLSLYVHFPWCIQKCPYCDFNSHQRQTDDAEAQEREYLQALIQQLDATLPRIWGRPVETIFFGGGTPSLMSVEGLNWLMSQLRARLGFGPQTEVTLEANPGAMDTDKFTGFREAGINRLSLGVQSFQPRLLKALGRIHSVEEAENAFAAAREAGFDRINLDLMFALPEQTLHEAAEDVKRALALAPDHISYYQLTLEPNTPFYRAPPLLPDDDQAWLIQEQGHGLLRDAGFEAYEVSAWARQNAPVDQRCRHNLNYWQFGDYIGLGAGAHGKLTLLQSDGSGEILRTQMPASPGSYQREVQAVSLGRQPAALPGRVTRVAEDERVFEFLLNLLRLQSGFALGLFAERTGLPESRLWPTLLDWQEKGWMTLSSPLPEPLTHCALTETGHRYLNTLLQTLLDE